MISSRISVCDFGEIVRLSLRHFLKLLVERVFLVSKRFFGVPSFFNYAIADGISNILFPDKTALRGLSHSGIDAFQLRFEFG